MMPGNQQAQLSANMGLSGRGAIHYHTGSAIANETIQILTTQRVNIFITDATYTLTVSLPSVAAAAGMWFSFYIGTDGGQDVTIRPYTDGGSAEDDTDFDNLTLADVNDRCLLFSDGIHWHPISTGLATTE